MYGLYSPPRARNGGPREAEFRAESFNILNHAEFDSPNVNNFGSPTFGQITSTTNKVNGTAGDPNSRIIQLGLRVSL